MKLEFFCSVKQRTLLGLVGIAVCGVLVMVYVGTRSDSMAIAAPATAYFDSLEQVGDFDIPKGTVFQGMDLWTHTTGYNFSVLNHESDVAVDQACAVKGKMRALDAVAKLLVCSGWKFEVEKPPYRLIELYKGDLAQPAE